MNLQEIKAAVEAGETVHWVNQQYVVIKDTLGRFLIKCLTNDSCNGLTWTDGQTLNGKESQFYKAANGGLALYVWEPVLTDYTDGMVCVLARDEVQAWHLLKAKDHTAWWTIRDRPDDRNDPRMPDELASSCRPRRVEAPEAFVCWGGG